MMFCYHSRVREWYKPRLNTMGNSWTPVRFEIQECGFCGADIEVRVS